MADQKTKPTGVRVEDFIESVESETRRTDAYHLLRMMKSITGEPPVMWGPSMIGFGSYHYKYASGHEGDSFITGFSPRKASLVVYIIPGFDQYKDYLARLGPHKTGSSCLYIKRLADIDTSILEELIRESYRYAKKTYQT